MSRAQQQDVLNQAQGENQTYNTNAQTSFNTANTDIADYNSEVGAFKAANPYGVGGPVRTAQNQEASDTAAGMAQSAGSAIQGAAVRTGQNAGGAIAATENMQEQNTRQLSGQEAGNTVADAGAGASYNAEVLGDVAKGEGMQDTLAQQQAAAAQGALGTQEQAAQTPSFMEEIGPGLFNAAVGVGANWACPAKGSLYLMANNMYRAVETLREGDQLSGIDGEDQVIEEIQVSQSPVLRITLDDGTVVRNSRVHAFALPFGGFTVAAHSMGKIVRTAKGRAKVISIEPDGIDLVYNVMTDGSHTYLADGVWALGVGEAERCVSMEKWNEIGDKLEQAVNHGR